MQYENLYVVGIGASAGGLEAINELFDNLPSNTGLAFVIVQHLSPDFKSLMDELLKKHTSMSIQVIKGDTPVLPNHIYLISRDKNISIKNGIIRQVKRSTTSTINLPIDVFFHALGKDFKERAIGVILSGSGTDGSRGLRTIKEEGGYIFAQDPETAQFDGMPQSAIASNLADNILPPHAIAKELVRIAADVSSQTLVGMGYESPENLMILDKILKLVFKITKVDFKDYRPSTLIRRTEKRMYINHIIDLEEYYNFLANNETEAQVLGKEFLIGVTRFFRDPEAFDRMYNEVIPAIVDSKKPNDQIRIWVPGCSTGEEAISITLLLLEYLEKQDKDLAFKVFATDIDKNALQFANQGKYLHTIISDIPKHLVDKYFTVQHNTYWLKKEVQNYILFTYHNAISDPPFIHIDLVSCRNMLIYLKPKLQNSLLHNFQFSLLKNGFLFLGPSESIGELKAAFKPISNKWNIFQNISDTKLFKNPVRRENGFNIPDLTIKDSDSFHMRRSQSAKFTEEVLSRYLVQFYAPLSICVNEHMDILYINGNIGKLLFFPQSVVSLNLSEMVGKNELLFFKNGIRKTLEADAPIKYKDFHFSKMDESFQVDICFHKVQPKEFNYPVVLIELFIKENKKESRRNQESPVNVENYKNQLLTTLEKELEQVSLEKQTLVEQLETANEELQSSNEELLSANEELQSTNEELQSVNEELYTLNSELQIKIQELIITNQDISNLLNASNIGTILLDGNLCIRKFTPALEKQFDLIDSDIGRPITSFSNTFNEVSFYEDIKKVMQDHGNIEREIKDKYNESYLMRIFPYRVNENRVDGVVITFIDINKFKKLVDEQKASTFQVYNAIIENVENDILIMNADGIIDSSNFTYPGFTKETIIGKSFIDLFEEDDQKVKIKDCLEKIKEGVSISYTWKFVDSDGKVIWYNDFFNPIYIKNQLSHILCKRKKVNKKKVSGFKSKKISNN